jgi:antitoxin (DNA-binding transcriptional repressor) of toxin-antitoxin stability system
MNTITTTELRQHLSQYLVQAQAEEVVVTLDGGRLVRLSGMSPEDLADAVIERDARFGQLIAERRAEYRRSGGISLATVRQTLINELIADLDHPDWHVRQEAGQHLLALGEPALQPLIAHYLDRKGNGSCQKP